MDIFQAQTFSILHVTSLSLLHALTLVTLTEAKINTAKQTAGPAVFTNSAAVRFCY